MLGMGFLEMNYETRESYLEYCQSSNWTNPTELKFLGKLFDYAINCDNEEDPLKLDELLLQIEAYDRNNEKEYNEFIGKIKEIFESPDYDIPEELKIFFQKNILEKGFDRKGNKSDVQNVILDDEDNNIFENLEKDGSHEAGEKNANLLDEEDHDLKELYALTDKVLIEKKAEFANYSSDHSQKVVEPEYGFIEEDLQEAYNKLFKAGDDGIRRNQKGDIAEEYSHEEYMRLLRENGWTDKSDLAVFDVLYRISEIVSYRELNKALNMAIKNESVLNADERMVFYNDDVIPTIKTMCDKKLITRELSNKIQDQIYYIDQKTIDESYKKVFKKDRPKTYRETKRLQEQKKNLLDGETEILDEYDYTTFIKKAEENGWSGLIGISFISSAYNYKANTKHHDNNNMDLILKDIINHPIWGEAARNKVLKRIEDNLLELKRDWNVEPEYRQNIMSVFNSLKSISQENYNEKYLKAYGKPLERTEEDRKAERENKEAAYHSNTFDNRKKFDREFKLSEDQFVNYAKENGWFVEIYPDYSDEKGISKLYEIARDSGNEKLKGILNRILATDIKTKEARDGFVKEITDQISEVLNDDSVFGNDEKILKEIVDGKRIKLNVTEKEFKAALDEFEYYEQNKNQNENQKIFRQIMEEKGWTGYNRFLNDLFRYQTKRVVNRVSPIDEPLQKFMDTKISSKYPASSRNTILRNFQEDIKKCGLSYGDQFEINKMINEAIEIGAETEKEEQKEKQKEMERHQDFLNLREEMKQNQAGNSGRSIDDTDRKVKNNAPLGENEGAKGNAPAAVDNQLETKVAKLVEQRAKRQREQKEQADKERFSRLKNLFDEPVEPFREKDDNFRKVSHTAEKLDGKVRNGNQNAVIAKADDIIRNDNGNVVNANAAKPEGDNIDKTLLSIREIHKVTNEAYNAIAAVNYVMLGMGSPEFDNMLKKLKGLKDYAESELKENTSKLDNLEMFAAYYDRQRECIKAVRRYIKHKQKDLQDNQNRRESGKRQKREQPRINAALDVLEKLEVSYAKARNSIILYARKLRKPLEDNLKAEETMRDTLLANKNYDDYYRSVGRSADTLNNLDGRNWEPKKENGVDESLNSFVRRVRYYADKDRYNQIDAEIIRNPQHKVRPVLLLATAKLKGVEFEGVQYNRDEKLTNENIKDYLKSKDTNYAEKERKLPDITLKTNEIKSSVSELKDQMLSVAQKAKNAPAPGR